MISIRIRSIFIPTCNFWILFGARPCENEFQGIRATTPVRMHCKRTTTRTRRAAFSVHLIFRILFGRHMRTCVFMFLWLMNWSQSHARQRHPGLGIADFCTETNEQDQMYLCGECCICTNIGILFRQTSSFTSTWISHKLHYCTWRFESSENWSK